MLILLWLCLQCDTWPKQTTLPGHDLGSNQATAYRYRGAGGEGGAEWQPGLLRLTHPPTHPPTPEKFSSRTQMKFIKGTRNWKSIRYTNFFLASDPPTPPGVGDSCH